jgi:hypothetical protein
MARLINTNYGTVLSGCIGFVFLTVILLPVASNAAEITFVPTMELVAEYDDNIDFTSNSQDEQDDFAGSAIPEATLEYRTERLKLNSQAHLDFKRYLNDTEFDRTNQFYLIDTEYQAYSRWKFFGGYQFRRDETTDTQFEQTGRVFQRSRENRQDARGGVQYNLTELTDVGSFILYRRSDFSSRDDTDYHLYTIEVPFTKRFQNQIDTIKVTPAYSKYKSDDNEKADDYRFTVGWQHLISETSTFNIVAGPRYTSVEDNNGETNGRFGGVGAIGLEKKGETFSGNIRFSHDLRSSTQGEIINVDRLYLFADKQITERFGARFRGNGYYSNTENKNEPNDKVLSFELIPTLYYMLTENHSVELTYNYRNQRELNQPGNPSANRNRVMLGFIFRFPKKWD